MSSSEPTDLNSQPPPEEGRCQNSELFGSDHRDSQSSYQLALKFLYERINYERIVEPTGRYKFRLQRITELLRRLGLSDYLYRPQADRGSRPTVPLIHIAGTKGKGSTAAMVSAVLTESGLKTGLYTSPHFDRLEERFRINGVACSEAELIDLVRRVAPATEAVESELGPPSFFELTTALALLHFDTADCDAIVLEVGLGGRLDSTNVCAPSVSVITSIGLDHQHVLGETLPEIAAEKGGIIKPSVPVISGVSDPPSKEVIARIAAEHGADLFQWGTDFHYLSKAATDWGSQIEFQGVRAPIDRKMDAPVQMEGKHQAHNAAVAIATLELLRDQGLPVTTEAIEHGLGRLHCVGRIERFELPEGVTGIVDAAHNGDSVDALCETLRLRRGNRPLAVVFGTSIDKDAQTMLATLTSVTPNIVLTRFWGNPRFRPTADLVDCMPKTLRSKVSVVEDPIDACQRALPMVAPGGILVACGSFFLAAETRQWFANDSLQSDR